MRRSHSIWNEAYGSWGQDLTILLQYSFYTLPYSNLHAEFRIFKTLQSRIQHQQLFRVVKELVVFVCHPV